jgi:SAM-dependent methyltransferase
MGMLGYARGHLPLAQGDAARLPFRTASVTAASSIMVHTDMPGYLDVLAEIHRVLAPGGALVHLGVHPCFCGGFADRSDPAAVVVRPGYLEAHWTKASYTDRGIRARLGSNHWPLPDLLGMFIDVGFSLEAFAEGGAPAPIMLAIKARKRRQADVPAPPP